MNVIMDMHSINHSVAKKVSLLSLLPELLSVGRRVAFNQFRIRFSLGRSGFTRNPGFLVGERRPTGRGPRRCTCAVPPRLCRSPTPPSLSMAAVRHRLKGPPGSASFAVVAHHPPPALRGVPTTTTTTTGVPNGPPFSEDCVEATLMVLSKLAPPQISLYKAIG
ncbi:hypothetical protein GW17_00007292 [Ensete ventricosum]|nr:hypothetical protein GW17_00007292 [Ensete ventricosum]